MTSLKRLLLLVPLALLLVSSSASAAAPGVGWSVSSVAQPTRFQESDGIDEYVLTVANVGGVASSGTVTLRDELPAHVKTSGSPTLGNKQEGVPWTCSEGAGQSVVTCTLSEPVPALEFPMMVEVPVKVESGAVSPLENRVTVEGGITGVAPSAKTSEQTEISSSTQEFGLEKFGFEVDGTSGQADMQAGDHPSALITSLQVNNRITPGGVNLDQGEYLPAELIKDVVVTLPQGFVGDPLATGRERCLESSITTNNVNLAASACPPSTQVGVASALLHGTPFFNKIKFYNVTPEAGYPAEFGANIQHHAVIMHASVGPAPNYRLQVTVPGLPTAVPLENISLLFFGDPAEKDGAATGPAFFTNPTDCSGGPSSASIAVDSWQNPEVWSTSETMTYPEITGCDLLQYEPTLQIQPEETQADTPSGYEVDLKVPQSTNQFPDLATPELRDTTVTLPEGVSISPSAADGLVGCRATGPEGLNAGSGEVEPDGRDKGDPEATELGEGHPGGNGSPYDDGLYHTAPGHCPAASQIGTVELETPLLPSPLKGRAYLAQPECGGAGQAECTEQLAEEGKMYGLYLEIEGEGVIVKLKGSVEAGGNGRHSQEAGLAPGQLRTTFTENPQLPFSELKLRLKGGARAPLANPQSCGSFTTQSSLTSWASATPVESDSSFGIGGCAGDPFAPAFSAGTVTPLADAFSPFTLTFSRHDGEQDLSGLTVMTPPGLLGVLKGVVQCPEPQAAQGTCGEGSLIGHTEVAAGAGSHPFWVQGRVYLTGPYARAPFGLSVVTPAKAGPFNLGNVIVRARIEVNASTSALTVTSNPLPQIIDGVPLRIQTVNVTIDRTGFMFNPTNCEQQQITGTITSAQGAPSNVTSPFAVTGCAGLPFKPSFTASTAGKTSKANGASLVVKVAQRPGEANIRKVDLTLPLVLPARLTTLQKACTEAQFNTNPAGCPQASIIGHATAVTPVLGVPLTGPAYLVSHGGAAFPDVEFILQGDDVTIVLDGKTDIKKGITYSRFETVPDAPISSFETTLPEGPHSALAANGNLCATTKIVTVKKRVTVRSHGRTKHLVKALKRTVAATSLVMPTTIVAQNGAQITQTTKIAVTGCAKAKPAKKKAKSKKGGKK